MKKAAGFMAVVIAACSLAATASAGPEDGRPGDRRGRNFDPERRARMIEEFDTDGDGKLSEDERDELRETMRERRANGEFGRRGPDGERPPRGERRRGEGRNRGPEGRQGRGPEGRRGGPPMGPPRIDPGELFSQFDKDGNDSLSREEFEALSDHVREIRREVIARLGRRGPGGPPEYGEGPDGPSELGQRFGPPHPGMEEGSGSRRPEFRRRGFRGEYRRRGRPDRERFDRDSERPGRPADDDTMEESDNDEKAI